MMDVRQDYTDMDGDALTAHTDGLERVWLRTGPRSMGVVLSPKQVKKLRKQLKQWLKNNGHLKSKGTSF